MKELPVFLLVLLFGCANLNAQGQNFQTQRISIFKNNQAFFSKSGQLTATNGKYLLPDPAPAALYGTLWFSSPEGSLTRIASYPDTLLETKTAPSVAIWDLLRSNVGKRVSVMAGEATITGTLISVSPVGQNGRGEPIFSPASLVAIQSEQGLWTTIPAGQIQYANFTAQPNLEVEHTTAKPRHLIELGFRNGKAQQPIDLMYLANGLNWAPQYLLELTGENTATLTMQGEVVNDAEDIRNTTVNLVVGVPNFAYANRLAYLIDFLQVINPVAFQQRQFSNTFSNAITSQQIAYGGDAEDFATSDEVEGSRNEDLFFFTLKNFSLPKGGRSMHQIFTEKVAIDHIYECKLPGNNENDRSYESSFLFAPQTNKVFHTLRMENKLKQPWTTAPILVLNAQGEQRPISQDLMTYTPVGGKTFVKLTEAVDVKVEQAERETSRQENVWRNRNNQRFDLVQVEGKIKVKNFKDKKLDLRLQRTIFGVLHTSSVDWLREEVVNPSYTRNRKTNVCWEPSINANSELEITYTYEIYVYAN